MYHPSLLNSVFFSSFFEYRERYQADASIMSSYIYLFYYLSKSGEPTFSSLDA